MTTTRRAALAVVAAISLAGLAACGSDDDAAETGSPPDTTAPETAAPEDTDDTEGDAPERIVSLSPSATEILFAVGAGDQVVAVDDQSDFPEDVPTTDLSGYEPNVEAIIEYEPDLVVADFLAEDIVAGLEAAGAEVLAAGRRRHPRGHLRPGRRAGDRHRPRGRGCRAGRRDAGRHRRAGGLGARP